MRKAIARVVGPDEVQLAAALALIGVGCWMVWSPAAFLVPGAVLLWIALPARLPFIVRPGVPDGGRRRDVKEE